MEQVSQAGAASLTLLRPQVRAKKARSTPVLRRETVNKQFQLLLRRETKSADTSAEIVPCVRAPLRVAAKLQRFFLPRDNLRCSVRVS
jgi:hypothetical protein